MQRWQDELAKHPINTTLKQFTDAATEDIEVEDPILLAEKVRFDKFVRLLKSAVDELDPDLAPIDLLNQIQSQLHNHGAIDTAINLPRNRDPRQFRSLNDQINPSLSYLAQLRAAAAGADTATADVEAASLAVEALSKGIAEKRQEYEVAANAALMRIDEAKDGVTQLAKTSKSASKAFDDKLVKWQNEIEELLSSARRQFSEAINDEKAKARQNFLSFSNEQVSAANEKQAELTLKLDDILKDASERYRQILDLYQLVARDSVTGGHKEIADREFRAAETWRRITIASLVVAAAWITFSLFFTTPVLEPERAFWLGVGKSISLTVLLVSFAVYASKQASIHRLNERKARAFFLQVQAFDPFIASLPEETRVALKQALSSRIFGADDSEGDRQVLEAGELKTFDRFLDLAERLKKLVIR